MNTVVRSVYQASEFGVETELSGAGTSLENPFVYDSAARELRSMADQGLVRIIRECVSGEQSAPLISRIAFARLR
jgi:hypothetical protein